MSKVWCHLVLLFPGHTTLIRVQIHPACDTLGTPDKTPHEQLNNYRCITVCSDGPCSQKSVCVIVFLSEVTA